MCYPCGYGRYENVYCTDRGYSGGDVGPFEDDAPTTFAYGEEQ